MLGKQEGSGRWQSLREGGVVGGIEGLRIAGEAKPRHYFMLLNAANVLGSPCCIIDSLCKRFSMVCTSNP